ncbi:MAG TPA: hypothetical protein VFK48_09920 [Usitatibacter sp.]|nr:hypothetical protein [Usitatibacter sp.]
MRKRLPASELHDLLTREFRGTAGDHCLRCRVPMPSWVAGAKRGPNWRIGTLDECSTLCHTILEDVAAKLADRYDIQAP